MKKYILVLVSIVILTLSLSNNKVEASDNKIVNINYFRYNGDYKDWTFWVWTTGGSGISIEIDTIEDGWATSTIDLNAEEFASFKDTKEIWFIIRKGEWLEKDIDNDRFFYLNFINGECNIYLGQGDPNVGYFLDDPNGPDTSHKFLTANFSSESTINFTTTKSINEFIVLEDDNELEYSILESENNEYTIKLKSVVDLKKKYIIRTNIDNKDKSIEVGFSSLYDTEQFSKEFDYDGELGVIYTKEYTIFRVWSPLSDEITLMLYNQGSNEYDNNGNKSKEDKPYEVVEMNKLDKGIFEIKVLGDLKSKYYTFMVKRGIHENEVVDPYAYSTGVNGLRGMIVDFNNVNPTNWEYNKRPNNVTTYNDNVIYELHVRDLTSHKSWNGNDDNRGKFLGLVEEGTSYNGYTTGFDHIKELGVTSVHLLPVEDYGYVDETKLKEEGYFDKEDGGFNWGYMTQNYNTLEGSYSTNPFNGEVRVNEFKQMIQGFHNNDIRVIMDVVYNHTATSQDSNFNILVPGYYHRLNENGSFSNGSGCGNETASNRTMMRKLIVDSVLFYAREYNISGFRFDLMALHDIETMNIITEELHKIDSSIIVYGEPWDAGGSALGNELAANKENISKMPNVAIFNDTIRDSIKGSVFESKGVGFVQGVYDDGMVENIVNGLLGNNYPNQMINYVSAHDNNTLNDKLKLTGLKDSTLEYAHKQANAIVLLSQGIPFLHAGVELRRTKPSDDEELYNHNSYNASDSVNQIRWDLKEENIGMFNYYKSLIKLRKEHPAFRMTNNEDILNNIEILDTPNNTIALHIKNNANEDIYDNIIIAFNNSTAAKEVVIPEGEWTIIADKLEFNSEGIYKTSDTLTLSGNDTVIMFQGITVKDTSSDDNRLVILISLISIIIVLSTASLIVNNKRR